MFCVKCGAKINDTASFCPFCGQSHQAAAVPVSQPVNVQVVPVSQPASAPVNQPVNVPVVPVSQPAQAPVNQPAYVPNGQPANTPNNPAYNNSVPASNVMNAKPGTKKPSSTADFGWAVLSIVSTILVLAGPVVLFSTTGGSLLTAFVLLALVGMIASPIALGISGSRKGVSFNFWGLFSIIGYGISLVLIPISENKYSDSFLYGIADNMVKKGGNNLTPTQFQLLGMIPQDENTFYVIITILAIIIAVIYLCEVLARNKTLQRATGIALSAATAIMLFMDYSLINSNSVVSWGASKAGFSMSWKCIIILGLAIFTIVAAQLGNRQKSS